MIILQILFPAGGIGGVERIASQLLEFSESYIGIDKRFRTAFVEHFDLDENRVFEIECSSPVKCIKSLKSCINRLNPDIIQTHARKEMILSALCSRSHILVRTQHMAENPRIPVTIFEKILLNKKIDKWIATSQHLASTYLSNKKYIHNDKISVVYNGAESGKERTTFDKKHHFCIIGRLTTQKGVDIIIRDVSTYKDEVKNLKIDIWGEGDELDSLVKLIKELDVESIFAYRGTTKKPSEIVVNYDALLMPSRNEGLPLTMLECMSTGTPVAIHNVGCVKEFIVSGKNGWIIDNSFSWHDFFTMNLSNEDYKKICEGAKKTFLNRFTLNKMKNDYMNIYKNLLSDFKTKNV